MCRVQGGLGAQAVFPAPEWPVTRRMGVSTARGGSLACAGTRRVGPESPATARRGCSKSVVSSSARKVWFVRGAVPLAANITAPVSFQTNVSGKSMAKGSRAARSRQFLNASTKLAAGSGVTGSAAIAQSPRSIRTSFGQLGSASRAASEGVKGAFAAITKTGSPGRSPDWCSAR